MLQVPVFAHDLAPVSLSVGALCPPPWPSGCWPHTPAQCGARLSRHGCLSPDERLQERFPGRHLCKVSLGVGPAVRTASPFCPYLHP